MASATASDRVAPAGFRLTDGYQSLIAFAGNLDAVFFEMDVQPPGIDGGDPVNTTTQQNSAVRTFAPRWLYTLMPHTVRAAYDPCFFQEAIAGMINMEDAITIHFPDGSTLAFWGYLQRVEFDPLVEGELPTLTMTIVPTNYDPNNCVEAEPVMVCAGTC